MKPYVRIDNKGRTIACDDIHHRTADQSRNLANKAAKAAKHGARQYGRRFVTAQLSQISIIEP